MNELSRIENFIKTVLVADQELAEVIEGRIFEGVAKEGTKYPYITFALQSAAGADVRVTGRSRPMTGPLYLIKVVCDGSPDNNARVAVNRIDEVIGKAVNLQTTIDGDVMNFSAYREEPFSRTQNDGAHKFRHLGGIYRIIAYV